MSFSKWAFGFAVALSGVVAVAQQSPGFDLQSWMEKSERIINGQQSMPEWLKDKPSEQAMQAAEMLKKRVEVVKDKISKGQSPSEISAGFAKEKDKTAGIIAKAKISEKEIEEVYNPKTESFIFISQSMSQAEVKAAIEVSTETGATLVFRGIKPGQAIDHISKFIADIIRGKPELTPSVIINPVLFTEYEVESVPTAVVIIDGKMIRATGTISIDYLISEMQNDKLGDLGLVGSVKPVVEPDMIEEMKRRTALIDWDKQKEGAADRFWTQSWPKISLAASDTNESYLVDPTFTLNQDIVAQGRILAAKGSQYNAQKIMPMSQIIVFFDGTDAKQIAAVKKYMKESNKPAETFVLIITELNREKGFEDLERLNETFGRDMKVIEKGMKERFKLRSVPSVVTGYGDNYKVQQIAVRKKS